MIPTKVGQLFALVRAWPHWICVAVGGCEFKDRDDPGNLELDWLEVQLKLFRERGMHVSDPGACGYYAIED